jgi:asparagine synthetase B (glutamine-hydrolysing)
LVLEFKDLFSDAIKLRLRSDVAVGTSLSGVSDSSAISAIASAEIYQKNRKKSLLLSMLNQLMIVMMKVFAKIVQTN